MTITNPPIRVECVSGCARTSAARSAVQKGSTVERIAVRTAILSTVEPFWTALLAALVLAQPLTHSTLIGGFVIVIAILLLQRTPHPAIPDAPPPE